jgi:hypothetical protein
MTDLPPLAPLSLAATGNVTTATTCATQAAIQQQATKDSNNADDVERSCNRNNKDQKAKEKDLFKGEVEKMNRHVFQLPEEAKKPNQFTKTMEALQNYTVIEYGHTTKSAPCSTHHQKTLTFPNQMSSHQLWVTSLRASVLLVIVVPT